MRKLLALVLFLIFIFYMPACTTQEKNETGPILDNPTTVPLLTTNPDSTKAPPATKPAAPAPSKPYLVYSPYVVPLPIREYLGDDYLLYCQIVDSVINYDGQVSGFESEEQFFKLWSVLLGEFYPAQKVCETYGTSEEPYTYSNGTAQIKFQLEQTEHDEVINKFADRITQDLSLVKIGDSEVEIIAKLYMHVSTSIQYTYGAGCMYDCIMNNAGICSNYAEYLIFLLNHAGVECHYAGCSGAGTDHAWVIAKMGGQYYHFDPTWESVSRNWQWFGMSDEVRHASVTDPVLKDSLKLFGDWDKETGKWLLPKECPETYCPNSRETGDPPWMW